MKDLLSQRLRHIDKGRSMTTLWRLTATCDRIDLATLQPRRLTSVEGSLGAPSVAPSEAVVAQHIMHYKHIVIVYSFRF
jgi:hypothetical protein